MEEEIIKRCFCNYCLYKGNNDCMKVQKEEKSEIKIYKCINYKKGTEIPSINNALI